jgi:hypothetical protein
MYDKIVLVQEEPRGPSQTIEVPVTGAASNSIPFPEIQQLKSQQGQTIIIKAMRLITQDVLTNGIITGFANAPLTELQKITLVIYCEGWQKALYLPVLTLNDVGTPGGTFPHRYHNTRFSNWQNVDWSKSFLIYSNGTTSVPGEEGYCVMFDVEYIKINGNPNSKSYGQEIIGPS